MGLRDWLHRRTEPPGSEFHDIEGRVVWLLGSPRTGTTWLINLLIQQPGFVKLDEPGIGIHLGLFLHEFFGSPARHFPSGRSMVNEVRAEDPDYFFADAYADVWRPHLRTLVLARVHAHMHAHMGAEYDPDAICLVKEPNGSQAAEMLLTTMPVSRLLWVLRDGRDVVDSKLDGIKPGGWISEYGVKPWDMTSAERLRYIEDRSYRWLRRTESIQAVYAQLPPEQRLTVRYEDLLADAQPQLLAIYAWCGRTVDAEQVQDAVQRLSFEKVPPDQRGAGKFQRSATPGAWRENLTTDEHELMQQVMGDKLRELGYR